MKLRSPGDRHVRPKRHWGLILGIAFAFALFHLGVCAWIEALGGEYLMTYMLLDAPLAMLGGNNIGGFLMIWGTIMYALAGGLLGWTIGGIWEWRRRRKHKDGCRKCGYNLTGNVSGVCPECGTPVDSEANSTGKGKGNEPV